MQGEDIIRENSDENEGMRGGHTQSPTAFSPEGGFPPTEALLMAEERTDSWVYGLSVQAPSSRERGKGTQFL